MCTSSGYINIICLMCPTFFEDPVNSTSTFCECGGIELIPEEKQFISSRVLRRATKAWIKDNKDLHFHVVMRLFIGHCIIYVTPFPRSSLPPSSSSPVPGKRGAGGQLLPTAAVLSVYSGLREASLYARFRTRSRTLKAGDSCVVLAIHFWIPHTACDTKYPEPIFEVMLHLATIPHYVFAF